MTLDVISFIAIWIGVDTDHNDAKDLSSARLVFVLVENFSCFYFTWEVLTRFLAFGKKRNCIKDGWFNFGIFMVTETWILPVTLEPAGG